MGQQKKNTTPSRRGFLSAFLPFVKKETVKMLTADGQLVEVDKAVYDAAMTGSKAANKEILEWMNNPSKENNS